MTTPRSSHRARGAAKAVERPDTHAITPGPPAAPDQPSQRLTSPLVGGTEGGGAPFVYRLTPTSLERARWQGIPVARAPEFLGQASGAPVPRSVEAALTRWEARGTEAVLERTVLLPCGLSPGLSTEELMAQVASCQRTRALRAVAPSHPRTDRADARSSTRAGLAAPRRRAG